MMSKNMLAFASAAKHGDLNILKWMKSNNFELNSCTFRYAAEIQKLMY